MATPTTPADPRALVRVLEEEGVCYVVVGGWAAIAYGVDRATFDLDILVENSDGNAERLARALRNLDARRDLGAGVTEDLPLDEPSALLATPLRALTREGPLDVLTKLAGGATYEELRADARRATFGDGTPFVIASKQRLEAAKEVAAGQSDPARGDRDRRDLAELRSLPDPELPRADP